MGLIKDAIGSVLGANDIRNGFNGPKLPYTNNRTSRDGREDAERMSRSRSPYAQNMVSHSYEKPSGEKPSGSPPPYRAVDRPSNMDDRQSYKSYQSENVSYQRSDYFSQGDDYNDPGRQNYRDMGSDMSFRPFALPQIKYGDGQPFLRAYTCDLEQYGISGTKFIEILDAINIAIVPNPEMQIFQKGANIAGWFLPGAASIGLMAGQLAVGVGGAFGKVAMLNKVLATANLETFVPKGLEICIGKSKDVDTEVGNHSSSQNRYDMPPEERVAAYGRLLAPIDEILPPAQQAGRRDPIAMLGKGIGNRDNQRKNDRAQKRMNKGKTEKMDAIEGSVKWLIVRQATPQAISEWQKVLQQSNADLERAARSSQAVPRQ